jgi:hypothetical protein
MRDGTLRYSQCQMYDRNYSALVVQVETEEDLDRLQQQIYASNLSLSTTGCLHGWNFDYTEYATTVVTEVGHRLYLSVLLVSCCTLCVLCWYSCLTDSVWLLELW